MARMTVEVPFRPLPVDQSDVRYAYGPDSTAQAGVPAGETFQFDWEESKVYPGTSRKFWAHVPAQYDPAEPAALMVFQDGWWYLDPEGEIRGATVLDNLVHEGDIPVTIGIFVDPGIFPGRADPKNRNTEYDAYDDRYVSFLLTEIVPQVAERYAITEDPSGGAYAVVAAAATARSRQPGSAPTSSGRSSGTCPVSLRCLAATPTRRASLELLESRCAFSCKRATATWAGTNRRGTGSPTTFVSLPRSQKPGTTSVSSSATAAITPTTVASSSPTLSAGYGARTKSERPVRREYCRSDGRRTARRWRYTAVSRVDGTIRRSTGWWSDAVHALLGYLEASKFDAAPRYLGTDGHGREILSELPGRPCLGPELDGDELLASAASLIRRYHDLVAGWTYPPNGWQRAPGVERGGDVVCHNDLAPWNFLHKGGKITGLVDWDVAAPGTRAWDLAYFAYSWVPLAAQKTVPPWAARPTRPSPIA